MKTLNTLCNCLSAQPFRPFVSVAWLQGLHGRADEALVLKEVESAGGQKVGIPSASLTVALLMVQSV